MRYDENRLRVIGKNARTQIVQGVNLSFGSYIESSEKFSAQARGQVWCVDSPGTFEEWSILLSAPKSKRALIRFEPSVVSPKTHAKLYAKLFGRVLDVGRPNLSVQNMVSNWPQFWRDSCSTEHTIRRSRIAVINANKMSFIRGELYSLRRQVVTKSELIDVFGPGWQMSATSKVKKLLAEMLIALLAGRLPKIIGLRFWFRRPNNYSGLSNDKIETLRKYKYSLVIENSVEFLTEKLFDCFFSSTIPIYVGPPLSLFGIPENLVVQVDPDLESVLNGIKAAENVDYEVWVKSLKSWMGEDSTKLRWNAIDVYNDIAISILKN